MNVKVFQSTLHHLLYFSAFIKLVMTLIFMVTFHDCGKQIFGAWDQFPIHSKAPRAILFMVYSLLVLAFRVVVVFNLILSILNMIGAIFANQFPELIFAVGIAYLVYIPADAHIIYCFITFMFAIENFIEPQLEHMFNITNVLNTTALESLHLKRLAHRTFEEQTVNGWSGFSAAGNFSRMVVDYTQLHLQCCGLTGRKFWEMRVPNSCCPDEFANNCTFNNAHPTGCLTKLTQYVTCVHLGIISAAFLMLITITSTVVCLYYAYFADKYQDLTFTYEDSSSDDEF